MAGHFYNKEAELVEGDIRKARKEGLYPSVTTVCGILDKYGLVQWKIRQGIMSALTLPREPEETDEDYVNRVVKDSEEISKKATSKGTYVHDQIERMLKGEVVEDDPVTDSVREFVKENFIMGKAIEIETCYVNPNIETGCRIDCLADTSDGVTLIDWKTQNCKDGKFVEYDEWGYQLAGNSLCMDGTKIDAYWNVIVSVAPDTYGAMKIVKWSQEEIEKFQGLFLLLRASYKIIKNGV